MAQIVYAERALDDLDRLTDFLLDADPAAAPATAELIVEAMTLLANHPLVGRPAEDGMRELLISHGRTGYVALYGFDDLADTVCIYAIRHQREAGYLE